jgi:hypothetical protein
MNIKSTAVRPQQPAKAAAPAQPKEDVKPSAVDTFSAGAYSYADTANGIIGAYAGGTGLAIAGAAVGGAISLGGDIITAAKGALSGDAGLTLKGVLDAGLSAGAWAAGGAIGGLAVGGTTGFFIGRGASRFVGGIAGNITEKFGGNKNVGHAVGSMAVGALMGAKGAGIMGYNAAMITGGAALAGGAINFARS